MITEEFIQHFTEQFDDELPAPLTLETEFRELDGWSSFTALSVMAMVDEEYDVQLTATEMRSANTVGELYDIVKSRA